MYQHFFLNANRWQLRVWKSELSLSLLVPACVWWHFLWLRLSLLFFIFPGELFGFSVLEKAIQKRGMAGLLRSQLERNIKSLGREWILGCLFLSHSVFQLADGKNWKPEELNKVTWQVVGWPSVRISFGTLYSHSPNHFTSQGVLTPLILGCLDDWWGSWHSQPNWHTGEVKPWISWVGALYSKWVNNQMLWLYCSGSI